MAEPDFQGLGVLALESRRAREIGALISTYGGRPVVAPALREVPLESNPDALAFADALMRGEFDIVILLTGVGTRALVSVVERARPREEFIAALARTKVVARGPKPVAACRELQVPVWLTAPEPNTWREVLSALDAKVAGGLHPSTVARPSRASGRPEPVEGRGALSDVEGQVSGKAGGPLLNGLRMAVQEYGVSNPELLQGLDARGARVTRVPVYQWALPEDIEPLRAAITSVARGELDVALFTTATQVVHLFQVAETMNQAGAVRDGLRRMVVASIGPTTSEELHQHGLAVDLEASHPKMGLLVREAAERGPDLLRARRGA